MAIAQPPGTTQAPPTGRWGRLVGLPATWAKGLESTSLEHLARALLRGTAVAAAIQFAAAIVAWVLAGGEVGWLIAPGLFAVACAALAYAVWRARGRLARARQLVAPSPLDWGERTLLLLACLALALAGVIYGGLDELLRSLHRPGAPAHGLQVATSLAKPLGRAGRIGEATAEWRNFIARTPSFGGDFAPWEHPLRLAFLLTILDSLVIVPAYAIVLALLFRLTRRTIEADRLTIGWDGLGGWLRLGLCAVVLADWAENFLTFATIAPLVTNVAPADAAATPLGLLTVASWPATAVKVGGLALVGVALAVYWVVILSADRWPTLGATWDRGAALWATLLSIRVPLGLIALASLLLRVPQSNEIIRRWQTNLGEGVVALAAVALFAAACGFYGWLGSFEGHLASVAPGARVRPSWVPFAVLLAGAAGLSGLYWLQRRQLCDGGQPCNPAAPANFLLAAGPAFIILVALPIANALIARTVLSQTYAGGQRGRAAGGGGAGHPPGQPLGGALLPFLLAVTALATVGLATATAATELLAYNALRGRFEGGNLWLVVAAVILHLSAVALVVAVPDAVGGLPDGKDSAARARLREARTRLLARLHGPDRRAKWIGQGLSIAAVGCWLLVAVILFFDTDMRFLLGPVRALGTIAVAFLAFALLVAALGGFILLANDYAPHPAGLLNAIGMYRPPVLTLLVLWAYLGTSAFFNSDVHRFRTTTAPLRAEARPAAREGFQPEQALDDWVNDRCLLGTEERSDQPTVPIIFVAAEGGGIRAAAWSAYVLDRTFGTTQEFAGYCGDGVGLRRSDFLFALSGISGGSVGVATETAALLDPERPPAPPPCPPGAKDCTAGWVEAAMGDDHLAPAVAWLLAMEFPRVFLPVQLHADRAAVLERSFEAGWRQAGIAAPPTFLAARGARWPDRARPAIPLLLLNATSVESGCRFVASPLETNGRAADQPVSRCIAPLPRAAPATDTDPPPGALGATTDLLDLLCKHQDLPLATAAFISARFPYVSPTANVEACLPVGTERDGRGGYRPQTYLVDGGYLEGSGNATILALYETLLPHIRAFNANPQRRATLRPVLLTISNSYTEPAGPDLLQVPPQLTAPPATFGRLMGANAALASQEADQRFGVCDPTLGVPWGAPARPGALGAPCPDRRATFALQAHPGPRAELGWTLSRVAFADFVSQYEDLITPPGAASANDPDPPGCVVDRWFVPLGAKTARCAGVP